MTPEALYDEFVKIAETGDESAARAFLTEHMEEFPEETRNELISTFLTEAITEEAETLVARAEVEKRVLETATELKSARNEVLNQQRIGQLKEQLKKK